MQRLTRHGWLILLDLVDDPPGGLHADDQARAGAMAPPRRRTFAGGRLALLRALSCAGHPSAVALPSDDRGAPLVPEGFVGSIAHKDDVAAALAAPAEGAARVGVDVELARPSRVDVSRRVLTDAELAALAARPEAERALAVVEVFAVKEAVYKAIDPFVRRYVAFREVSLVARGDDHFDVESALPVRVEASIARLETARGIPVIVATARAVMQEGRSARARD